MVNLHCERPSYSFVAHSLPARKFQFHSRNTHGFVGNIALYKLMHCSFVWQEEDRAFLERMVQQQVEDDALLSARRQKARADAAFMKQVYSYNKH